MDENQKKYMKVKEEENLKDLHDETSMNSQSNFSETDIKEEEKYKKDISPNNKIKFKNKEHYLNKGNILKYFFDKNGIPKVVIGPHCKLIILLCLNNREIYYYFRILYGNNSNSFLFLLSKIFK
jgi:hypothetical protein